ncbi:hypothetical protein NX059_001914 [Plenodomus lindquistii]|nr:hypothetical protein NX059_001914 [Plenodomus lindquistii]
MASTSRDVPGVIRNWKNTLHDIFANVAPRQKYTNIAEFVNHILEQLDGKFTWPTINGVNTAELKPEVGLWAAHKYIETTIVYLYEAAPPPPKMTPWALVTWQAALMDIHPLINHRPRYSNMRAFGKHIEDQLDNHIDFVWPKINGCKASKVKSSLSYAAACQQFDNMNITLDVAPVRKGQTANSPAKPTPYKTNQTQNAITESTIRRDPTSTSPSIVSSIQPRTGPAESGPMAATQHPHTGADRPGRAAMAQRVSTNASSRVHNPVVPTAAYPATRPSSETATPDSPDKPSSLQCPVRTAEHKQPAKPKSGPLTDGFDDPRLFKRLTL